MVDPGTRAVVFCATLAAGLVLAPASVPACGWWGDGESGGPEATVIGRDGKPLKRDRQGEMILQELSVPGAEEGYGIVVYFADTAVPIARALGERPTAKIAELRRRGFPAVVDIGSMGAEQAAHRAETEALGMTYIHLPVGADGLPDRETGRAFHQVVMNPANRPLLVHADHPDMLAAAWVRHRLAMTVPWAVLRREARALGLSPELESRLAPGPGP